MKKKNTVRSAFTLIELMIVVIIVAILSAAAVPAYNSLTGKAYGTEVNTALTSLRRAQRAYHTRRGRYATKLTGENSLQSLGMIDRDDFESLKYVQWNHISLPDNPGGGNGLAVWNGGSDIPAYKYSSVRMMAGGNIKKTEKSQ